MEIRDIIPAGGAFQRIYCSACGTHCDLTFINFDERVSGVQIRIDGLPTLRCPSCAAEHLPDLSRAAILKLHEDQLSQSLDAVAVKRRKRSNNFGFTAVPFVYDPDDYFYLPGLYRPFDVGFLQPVYFHRRALLKYENFPGYRVRFASRTYGHLVTPEDHLIAFGINRFGNLVMWLGDIAKLPEAEQYFLRSENLASDHSIGSEFYDGQIEVRFTDPTPENELFRLRSEFIEACSDRFGVRIAHLDDEVLELALALNSPVADTPKERRHVFDTLNKIYLESLDNAALGKLIKELGLTSSGSGSLKRLQTLLGSAAPSDTVAGLMSPFYVLYDLRIVASHLASPASVEKLAESIGNRLGIPADADLPTIYNRLTSELGNAFSALSALMRSHCAKADLSDADSAEP